MYDMILLGKMALIVPDGERDGVIVTVTVNGLSLTTDEGQKTHSYAWPEVFSRLLP